MKAVPGICDRCGLRFRLKSLKEEYILGKGTGNRVCPRCYDKSHPQLDTRNVKTNDKQSVKDSRSDKAELAASRLMYGWNSIENIFRDDFRNPHYAGLPLETSPDWTFLDGMAEGATFTTYSSGTALAANSDATLYACPDLGTDEMYAQAKWLGGNTSGIAYDRILVRASAGELSIGFGYRFNSLLLTGYGTLFAGYNPPQGAQVGDIIRLEISNGSSPTGSQVRALLNGVEVIPWTAADPDVANRGVTRAGVDIRTTSDPWITEFEAGPL